jgi:hypothetical protein
VGKSDAFSIETRNRYGIKTCGRHGASFQRIILANILAGSSLRPALKRVNLVVGLAFFIRTSGYISTLSKRKMKNGMVFRYDRADFSILGLQVCT